MEVVVDASMGVMNTLLSKLSKLLEDEYAKLKGVRHQITFLRDELSSMKAELEMLADAEQLDPLKKEWMDKVRELAFDIEDCIDDFMDRVDDHEHDEIPTGLEWFIRKLKKLKACREIAGKIEGLKIRAIEASERHKRYNFLEPTSGSSTFAIDPRLPVLYKDVDRLVGIDGPKEHIIGWFSREKEHEDLKVLPIVGSGGLGKTTIANQVYRQLKGQFQCTAFVSVSRNPNIQKILRQMLTELGISDNTLNDERQFINRIRDYLKDKRNRIMDDKCNTQEDLEEYDMIVRTTFKNEEEGFQFYNKYAYRKGFGVRKDYVEHDPTTNAATHRRYLCSRQGYRKDKHMDTTDRQRHPRALTRWSVQTMYDYKQLELKLRHVENRAMSLGETADKLEVQCKELSTSSEIL